MFIYYKLSFSWLIILKSSSINLNFSCSIAIAVIGHGISGEDIPNMARLAKAGCWSK